MTKQYTPEWNQINLIQKECQYLNLSKDALIIDKSYQNPASIIEVNRIKNNWEPFLCNPLQVAKRQDGRYYVVDGQHRLLAAKGRDDVSVLPCCVFQSSGAKEEAQLYFQCNNNRRKPGCLEKYNALVTAGDPTRVHIADELKSAGMSTSANAKRSISVEPLVFVYDNYGESVFDNTLNIVNKIYDFGRVDSRVFKGIGYIISGKYTIPDYEVFVKTLIKVGPEFLYKGIKEHIFSVGHTGVRIFAEGVAIRVNYELKKRPAKKILPRED